MSMTCPLPKVPMFNKCKAASVSDCRYHNLTHYTYALEGLAMWEDAKKHATTRSEAKDAEAMILRYELARDVSAKGFKKLKQAYKQAVADGDEHKQLALEHRIQVVAEIRDQNDGKVDPWEQAEREGVEALTTLLLTEANKQELVSVPATSGNVRYNVIITRLRTLGILVTDLTLIHHGQDTKRVSDALTIQERNRLVSLMRSGESWKVGSDFSIRGMDFTHPDGRIIQVRNRFPQSHDDGLV